MVGFIAYRLDWFQCTFVSLVVVREDFRRKSIAREFFKSVEVVSPTPRLFSSTEETNVASIACTPRSASRRAATSTTCPRARGAALLQAHPAPRGLARGQVYIPTFPPSEAAMSEKTTLLSGAETELQALKRAIDGLGEAQMREVWLGTWSARDIVAHMSAGTRAGAGAPAHGEG